MLVKVSICLYCSSVIKAPHSVTLIAKCLRESNDWSARSAGMPALAMDSDFRWSKDNYSNTQRSIDIWSFIVSLRTKLWLLDQKWSYVGGWSEAKKTVRLRSTASWTR